jgi:flagellar biosynthesis protein FliQ
LAPAYIIASGPAVAAAMLVGLVIALLEALTVQEVTLTFVPKIIAIFIALIVSAPFVGGQIYALTALDYSRIEKGF